MNAQKYNPDVLTCLANLSNDEVFTPPDVANRMLDTLPNELWSNPEAKFLDPFCKSGVFLREIAKRLLKGLESQIPDLQERIDHIMHHQLYGIGITELTAYLSRRSLYCSTRADGKHSVTEFPDENGNIYFEEIAHTWDKAGKCIYCGVSSENFGEEKREGLSQHAYALIHDKNPYENMNFDVIIGNPPYQLNVGVESKSFAIAIYQKFIQQAKKLNPQYLCMIVPSRWFSGGRGLDDFRDEMLNDRRLKEIHDYPDASDLFSGVEVKGGVNYFLWDRDYNGDCRVVSYEKGEIISEMTRPLKEDGSDIFIRDNQAISIYHKVKKINEKSFSEIVSVQTPFGLLSSFKAYKKEPFDNAIKVYGNNYVGYISNNLDIKNKHWVDAHKVIVPKAIGSGNLQTDLVKPIYAEPNSCCTQTYLVIGPFANEERCKNVMSYIQTKFFHFMLGLKKITQDGMRGVYQFVPQQKFDKPWTDEELYEKYGLTEEEIAYIEKMVRPME
jgi:eco57I restriction endonuclease